MNAMTSEHPEWETFVKRLAGAEALNVQTGPSGLEWKCDGDWTGASRILSTMTADVDSSLSFFEELTCPCDCSVLSQLAPERVP